MNAEAQKEATEKKPKDNGNWRYTCQGVGDHYCGISSVAVQGPQKEALARSARLSGFKPVQKGRKEHFCRKCHSAAVRAEKEKRQKVAAARVR